MVFFGIPRSPSFSCTDLHHRWLNTASKDALDALVSRHQRAVGLVTQLMKEREGTPFVSVADVEARVPEIKRWSEWDKVKAHVRF